MSLAVRKTPPLAAVQDPGRRGARRFGVAAGGAADAFAARAANVLVGNDEREAVLELAHAGPELVADEDALVAVTGADAALAVDGVHVEAHRPVRVPAGSALSFAGPLSGARAWLAVAGGIDVPRWLGSRGTDARVGRGGLAGRALRAGDVLAVGRPSARARRWLERLAASGRLAPGWSLPLARRSGERRVRAVRGPEWELFPDAARAQLFGAEFVVTALADRMGLRLEGPRLGGERAGEQVSSAVVEGAVQVPQDGQPIVLLADHPTVGGYPRIAVVARVDLAVLAQLAPGDALRFEEIALAEAHRLALARERDLARAAAALALREA